MQESIFEKIIEIFRHVSNKKIKKKLSNLLKKQRKNNFFLKTDFKFEILVKF